MTKTALLLLLFMGQALLTFTQGIPHSFLPATKDSCQLTGRIYFVETIHALVRGRQTNLEKVKTYQDLYNLRSTQLFDRKGNLSLYKTQFSIDPNIRVKAQLNYQNGWPDSSLITVERAEKMYREGAAVFDVSGKIYLLDFAYDTSRTNISVTWDSSGVIVKQEKIKRSRSQNYEGARSDEVNKALKPLLDHIHYVAYLSESLRMSPPKEIEKLKSKWDKADRVVFQYDDRGNWVDRYVITKWGRVILHYHRELKSF